MFVKSVFEGAFSFSNTLYMATSGQSERCFSTSAEVTKLRTERAYKNKSSSEKRKKVKEMIRLDYLFMAFKINNLVEDSFIFVAVFILESLERILMAILSIKLRLVASEVVSLYLLPY